jgi:predicted RNA-binding protein with EMAP domain|tara:strand:- start:893 stop:1105 length:213 start_codon:yes stop_codon:yes gene_type:complete
MLTKLKKNLTRKHFIKQADEFIKQLKNVRNSYLEEIIMNNIENYCKLAIISNPRFDVGRFNDWIARGLYE